MSGFNSVLDSFYSAIVQQMGTAGAQITVPQYGVTGGMQTINQPFGGIVNAQDWPQTPMVNPVTPEGALFLLYVNATAIGAKSKSQILYQLNCQWVWVLIGQDIQASQQGLNRGDRHRTTMQIQDNLRQAHYPGYCRKSDYTADADGNVTSVPSVQPYPFSPIEMIWWGDLRFMPKSDNTKTGMIYGAAQIDVFGYSDVSASIA